MSPWTFIELMNVDWLDFLVRIWDALLWALTSEEKLALWLEARGVPKEQQVAILIGVNTLMIAAEIGLFVLCSKVKFLKKAKIPSILLKLTHGKPMGYHDLFLLAFTPGMQKFGSFAFMTRRSQLGFLGYVSLCIGGICRVATYPFLGDVIWVLIGALVVVRVFYWLRDGANYINGANNDNH